MEASELIKAWAKKVQINIATDRLTVYLTLFTPEDDTDYSTEDILELLGAYKITYGIDLNAIEDAILNKLYYIDTLIAEGLKPVDGESGEYEFQFEKEENKKPIILEDGSVDYNTLGTMTLVKPGDLLVKYRKAIKGTDGIDVFGKPIPAKNYKELNHLKGKGFLLSEDGLEYTASLEGKVEWKNEKLTVSELLIIQEDVDATTGDIDFNGDILVIGNVYTGTTIKAVGSITVNGAVESANLFAGKGILLKNGMQGGGKGTLNAKEDISGKFFEQAEIQTKGIIKANAIMNCNIKSGSDIVVAGKRGMIIGGITKALGTISASYIGNRAEIATEIIAGLDFDFAESMLKNEEEMKEINEKVSEIDRSIRIFTKQMETNKNPLLLARQKELLKEKIGLKVELSSKMKQKEELLEQKEVSATSKVVASKTVYVGSKISINNCVLELTGDCQDVTFKQKRAEVAIYTNH